MFSLSFAETLVNPVAKAISRRVSPLMIRLLAKTADHIRTPGFLVS
jgi:hypothetical protein